MSHLYLLGMGASMTMITYPKETGRIMDRTEMKNQGGKEKVYVVVVGGFFVVDGRIAV